MRITHILTHFPYEECHIDRLDKVLSALGEPFDKKPFFQGRNYALFKSRRNIFWFAGIRDNMDTDWVPAWTRRFSREFMNLIVVFIEVANLEKLEERLAMGNVSLKRVRIEGRSGFLIFRKRVELSADISSIPVKNSGIELAFYHGEGIPSDGSYIREVELRVIPEVLPDYRKILFSLPIRVEGSGGEYIAFLAGEQKLIIRASEPFNRAIVRFEPSSKKYSQRGLNILSLRMETL